MYNNIVEISTEKSNIMPKVEILVFLQENSKPAEKSDLWLLG